jgi:hypothetical protein
MNLLTDVIDRMSGVAVLKEKIIQLDKIMEGMQRIMIEQQKDIAEVKGQLKALIAMRRE